MTLSTDIDPKGKLMLLKTKLTVRNEKEEVIGWIYNYLCDHPQCITDRVNGKVWHATPREGELDEYHYRNLDDAIYALQSNWNS